MTARMPESVSTLLLDWPVIPRDPDDDDSEDEDAEPDDDLEPAVIREPRRIVRPAPTCTANLVSVPSAPTPAMIPRNGGSRMTVLWSRLKSWWKARAARAAYRRLFEKNTRLRRRAF
jgi:hypothetical protein